MLNRTASRYVVIGLLLTMMGVLAGLFAPGQADTDLGVVDVGLHVPVLVAMACLYALLLWNLVSAPGRYLRSASKQAILLPLLVFCVASAAWSDEPSLVMRRVLILVVTAWIGIMVGTDFSVLEIGRMVGIASVLHLAMCAVFFLFARHFLFGGDDPAALRGLTTHKNVFGFEQGLAVLVFLFCPFEKFRLLRWPLALLAGGALLWSHSSGSLIATVAALLVFPFLLVTRFKTKERLPLAALVSVVLVGLVLLTGFNIERIPALVSKDATLTGRTELWALVIVAIKNHLWVGYGFDAFWRGLEGDSLSIIRSVGWLVPTAHNGYLDLLLSIGVVGALLFLPILCGYIARALGRTVVEKGSSALLPMIFLVFLLVYNLNESALLTRSGLPFFLIVALGTAMSRSAVRVTRTPPVQRFIQVPSL